MLYIILLTAHAAFINGNLLQPAQNTTEMLVMMIGSDVADRIPNA